jgi:hypothetical protein
MGWVQEALTAKDSELAALRARVEELEGALRKAEYALVRTVPGENAPILNEVMSALSPKGKTL